MCNSSETSLSQLQMRVLGLLANMQPRWTLTGGGALALRLGHRGTRDVDLFWHGRATLDDIPDQARALLEAGGLDVENLRTTPAFVQLTAGDQSGRVIVDLVASPVEVVSPPDEVQLEGKRVLVDSEHEILANKVCALLSRSEIRDLWDVMELVERGGDLECALADATQKDGGFSNLTLAWVLEGFQLAELAALQGLAENLVMRLVQFKAELIELLTSSGIPGSS